jgi:hypothetical protein
VLFAGDLMRAVSVCAAVISSWLEYAGLESRIILPAL